MNKTKCTCDEKHLLGIQYAWNDPEHYDGVSEWQCTLCGQRVGRWSGRVLMGDDMEKRYGK